MPGFEPFTDLAEALLGPYEPTAYAPKQDGAHDRAHLMRVWTNAFALSRHEGGDAEIIAAAVLLHDIVAVEKNAPDRAHASRLSATRAAGMLGQLGWPAPRVAAACHAIEAHSFSAGIAPRTIEAKILQDADRLDAIGAIGIARCFYTAGRMGSRLYDPMDPQATHRPLDDSAFAIDHFRTKLLKLQDSFQTETGRTTAAKRTHHIAAFLALFEDEIGV